MLAKRKKVAVPPPPPVIFDDDEDDGDFSMPEFDEKTLETSLVTKADLVALNRDLKVKINKKTEKVAAGMMRMLMKRIDFLQDAMLKFQARMLQEEEDEEDEEVFFFFWFHIRMPF